MNRDVLKQIIIDQKEMYLGNPLISRDYDLEENVNYCFVGIRRTGKSYMMYQQIHDLMNDGISSSQIVYVNFEDERLLEIGVDDLNTILELGIEFSGSKEKPYLFLDEIQNVDGWEKFVRRVADMKYRINITGSNSKMLSKEIASTLGGRFMIVNVSLLLLENEIQFGSFNTKPVIAIVVLGICDKEESQLLNIANILDIPENIELLKNSKNIESILSLHD